MPHRARARSLGVASLVIFALNAHAVFAQTRLNSVEQRIVAAASAENARALQLLETLVNINSGTMNFEGVARVGEVMRSQLEPLGFQVRWVPMTSVNRAGHLIAEHKGSGRGKRMLLIGHMDTVFEKDSPFQKFERQGDKAVGPGVNELYMARFCKRILVIRDGLLVRDDPVADRLRAPDELLVVKKEEEAAKLLAAS